MEGLGSSAPILESHAGEPMDITLYHVGFEEELIEIPAMKLSLIMHVMSGLLGLLPSLLLYFVYMCANHSDVSSYSTYLGFRYLYERYLYERRSGVSI